MENTQERNHELYEAYLKFMNEINVTHAEAVALAVKSPASRYWVSPNYLYREIRRRERMEKEEKMAEKNKRKKAEAKKKEGKGKSAESEELKFCQRRCRKRMLRKSALYDALYSDYLTIRMRPTYRNLPIQTVCDLLVNRPAPSFFLSEKRAEECINKSREMRVECKEIEKLS